MTRASHPDRRAILKRLLDSDDASRSCPGGDELKAAFRITVKRTLRRSDGTVSVEGVRYQAPAPWRHLSTLWIRHARWDPSCVDLIDSRSGERLCTLYPLDKRGNAGGVRRPTRHGDKHGGASAAAGQAAPLLRSILDNQAETGLPPAWVPHGESLRAGEDDDRGDPS